MKHNNEERAEIFKLIYPHRESVEALAAWSETLSEGEAFREKPSEKWVKVLWYSDKCGGKVVTFKAGNPYGTKQQGRKDGQIPEADEVREERRLKESLSRTRKRIFEIAACNPWEWFFTGTLDGEKCDRNDLNGTFRKLSQFVRDFRKSSGCDVKYLIVPEQHKNGAWHFHGLLHGLPESQLFKFCTTDKIPIRIKRTIAGGTDVWTWTAYAEKFGYSTITRVRDENAVACYVTKYITKDMVAANAALGTRRHLYYASQGLRKPEVLAESCPKTEICPAYDFENEYVQISRITDRAEAEAIINRYGLRRNESEVKKCAERATAPDKGI